MVEPRPWQRVFPIPELEYGFEVLIELMNQFRGAPFGDPHVISSALPWHHELLSWQSWIYQISN